MVASSEQLRHRSNVSNTVPMQKWVDPSSGSNPSMVASSVPVLGTSQFRHRSNVSKWLDSSSESNASDAAAQP